MLGLAAGPRLAVSVDEEREMVFSALHPLPFFASGGEAWSAWIWGPGCEMGGSSALTSLRSELQKLSSYGPPGHPSKLRPRPSAVRVCGRILEPVRVLPRILSVDSSMDSTNHAIRTRSNGRCLSKTRKWVPFCAEGGYDYRNVLPKRMLGACPLACACFQTWAIRSLWPSRSPPCSRPVFAPICGKVVRRDPENCSAAAMWSFGTVYGQVEYIQVSTGDDPESSSFRLSMQT